MSLGLAAEDTVHEQMGSAQELAIRALRALGKPAYATERAARRWKRYDEETVDLLVPIHQDEDAYASIVRERRIALTQLFEKDLAELPDDNDKGWEIGRAEET